MHEILNKVKNRQKTTSMVLGVFAFIFALIMVLPFFDNNPLTGIWALAFIGIFLTISLFVIAKIFQSRAKKMDGLLSGTELLANWKLDKELILIYSQYKKSKALEKNKVVMWIVGILFVVITIPFLFFLEDDERFGFLLIIGSVFLIVLFSSLFFPNYYFRKNNKGDGQILIGSKYAYINGYFHNWDFPLSGLSKVKVIKSPFYGINLTYYFTDRTWQRSEELIIPAPENVDLNILIGQLKKRNGK